MLTTGRALAVGLAAVDAAWLFAWSVLLGTWVSDGDKQPLLAWPIVCLLLLGARAGARGIARLASRPRSIRLGLVGVGIALAALAAVVRFPGAVDPTGRVLVAGFALLLWWRGLLAGRGPVDFETLESAFRDGLIGLVLFVGLAAATTRDLRQIEAIVAPSVVAFFALGLTGLAMARLVGVRERSRARAGRPPAINHQWLGVMLGTVGLVVLAALALAAVVSFDLIAMAARPFLSVIGTVLYWVIYAIALPIGLLVEMLIEALRGRIQGRALDVNGLQGQGRPDPIERRPPLEVPPDVQAIAEWVAIAALVLAVGAILYRAIGWWQAEREDGTDEERDSVWSWREIEAALRALWARLRRRATPAPAAIGLIASARPSPPDPPSLRSVRELYRRLLALAGPRPAAATPYEHLPRLAAELDPDDDVAAITAAYVRARYSPDLPTDAELPELIESLARIRKATEPLSTPPLPPRG